MTNEHGKRKPLTLEEARKMRLEEIKDVPYERVEKLKYEEFRELLTIITDKIKQRQKHKRSK